MKQLLIALLLIYTATAAAQIKETLPENQIYSATALDVTPNFPEGNKQYQAYVEENFKKSGLPLKTSAKVHTTFIIEKNGSLSDIKILNAPNPRIAEKLIEIMKNSPLWNPGKISGKTVRVLFSIPFHLVK